MRLRCCRQLRMALGAGLLFSQVSHIGATTPDGRGKTYRRGSLEITVEPIRTVMRGVRTPILTAFRDGSLLVTAGSRTTGGQAIRSLDHGRRWRHEPAAVRHLNTLELADGKLLVIEFDPQPIANRPGFYAVKRWLSNDQGRSLKGPFESTLQLPLNQFNPALTQWFHGNLVQLPSGTLLSVMQGEEQVGERRPWRCYLVRSDDAGATWSFVTMLADWKQVGPLEANYAASGLRFHGAVEPNLVHLGNGRLVVVMRTVDDESNLSNAAFSPPSDTFEDLNDTVSGSEIYPGVAKLPKDKYYGPGPPSTPLLITRSADGGQTWAPPVPMEEARGCFPRMSVNGDLLALTYGGLSAVRWGNCITLSVDGGDTWCEEINVGPFLTTGYTSIGCAGPNRFVVFFDCTPPQPWTAHDAHWIGAVDVVVRQPSDAAALSTTINK